MNEVKDRIDFYRMREQLAPGSKFNQENLGLIPYCQLFLCAIGNAGAARCPVDLVRQEKAQRRARFVEMTPEQLETERDYLVGEHMHRDVLAERAFRQAPVWRSLSYLQQFWHLLCCIHHHPFHSRARLIEAKETIVLAGRKGQVPLIVAQNFAERVLVLLVNPPELGLGKNFSLIVAGYAEQVMQLMTPGERQVCAQESVQDYSCTSDCFEPIGQQD